MKALGYGSYEVVNLFAYRSTDPDALLAILKQPNGRQRLIGPENAKIIEAAIHRCDTPICAWGAHKSASSALDVRSLISSIRPAPFCFGVLKDGQPKHPLYVKSGTPLIKYAKV